MALAREQVDTAARIGNRVVELLMTGATDATILDETHDLMPDFQRLIDTAGRQGLDELCARYAGFQYYAELLKSHGLGERLG